MKRSLLLPAPALLGLPAAAIASEAAGAASAGNLFQVLLGLIVVLGLLAGAAWLLKRVGAVRPSAGNVARIVGGVSVGTRERVIVVEVADQWIVVGVAPGQVNSLATMPRRELPSAAGDGQAPIQPMPPFAAWLKKTIEKRNNG
ncbi:MAG TPA: flagellar biosynthetic protein FliO [Paucimonas sp.]|nr:flagellar biosynthetic protein FliO [Paucimonas sp.]